MIAAFALVAGACGSDDDDASADVTDVTDSADDVTESADDVTESADDVTESADDVTESADDSGTSSTADADTPGQGLLADSIESGLLTTAFVAARPIAYVDEDSGEATGSGLDLARTFTESLGIAEIETIFVTFDAMIPGLQAGRWDMSAFPFFITPERCDAVAFTDPVAKFTQGALVQPGNPLGITSYEDLGANDSIKIATQAGSAEEGWAKDAGVPDDRIQSFPEERLAIEAVRQGRADVYLQAAFSLLQVEENYGVSDLEVAEPFSGPIIDGQEEIAYAGFALRHEDVDLLNAINAEIAALNEAGQLLEIQAPYGYTEVQMPESDVRAKDLCPDGPWK